MRGIWVAIFAAIAVGGCAISGADQNAVTGAALPTADTGAAAPPEPEVHCVDNEATCLAQMRGRARRSGDLLTLRLDNGKTKTFKSESKACHNDDAQKCVHYALTGSMPANHAFTVWATYYEGHESRIVDSRDGRVISLADAPHFSPSGKRFVVVDTDDAHEYATPYGGIEIYSTEVAPPSREWSYNGPDVFSFVRWDGDDRVKLKVGIEGQPKRPDAEVVRADGAWKLNKP